MASPIPFPESNKTFVGGKGTDVKELPVHQTDEFMISKWRLTKPEIDEVIKTGTMWVYVWGKATPPISITPKNPFT